MQSTYSFLTNVKNIVFLRDIAHQHLRAGDNTPVEKRSWSKYCTWLFAQKAPDNSAHTTVLTTLDKYQDLSKAYVSQSFKYGCIIKPWADCERDESTDSRLWDTFCNWSFPGHTVQCRFFRVDKGKNQTEDKHWATEEATVFEKVAFLFLMARLCLLKPELPSAPSSEQRPENSSQHANRRANVPWKKVFRKDRPCAQRVGHALQLITRAWDIVARKLAFSSAEEMLLPYILFSLEEGCIKAISTRRDGYSPLSQSMSLSPSAAATTTLEHIADGLQHRSDQLDSMLRRLAANFLYDLHNEILSETLFAQPDGKWSSAERFTAHRDYLPTRFSDLDAVLQTAMAELGVGEEGLVFRTEGATQQPESFLSSSPVPQTMERPHKKVRRSQQSPTTEVEASGSVRRESRCPQDCSCHKAREDVHSFMEQFIRLYNCSFTQLTDTDTVCRPERSIDISRNVQLVLMDPPFNIRREKGRLDSAYDILDVDQMFGVVDAVDELLRPGGHVFIMCSAVQFAQWVVCFQEKTFVAENGKETAAFHVDEHDFIMVNAPGHYNGFAHRKSTSFVSFATKGFHAVKVGAGREDSHDMVRYESFGFVKSRLPAFVNVIDNVERLPVGERLFYSATDGCPARRVRAEQKSISLLQEIICRLSKPGDLVVDMFGGTFSTAVACMKIPNEQLRVFVGCELDKNCFPEADNWCVEEFSRTLLHFGRNAVVFPRPLQLPSSKKLALSSLTLLLELPPLSTGTLLLGFQQCLCFHHILWKSSRSCSEISASQGSSRLKLSTNGRHFCKPSSTTSICTPSVPLTPCSPAYT